MTAYVDYSYYTTTYLGTAIASANFSRLALRASEILDQITFNRVAPIVLAATDTATIDLIKKATCSLAETYQQDELNGGVDGIQSESIGSNSVSYADNASAKLTRVEKFKNSARIYLGSSGLLFKGFADGEYGVTPSNAD